MFDITTGYLTGEYKAIENHLNSDTLIPRRPYTWGQMFFKPYESTTEYVYCARHTLMPAALVGLFILNPLLIVAIPMVLTAITITLFALMGISEAIASDNLFSFAFHVGLYLAQDLCQGLIDLALLPVAALAMVTRGVSTGLQATGIYDYDANANSDDEPVYEALSI